MRLFIAIDIDAATRAQLMTARRDLEDAIVDAPVRPRISWVDPAIAHATVRFIGEVPEHALNALQKALASLAVDPFDVIWDRIGSFGSARNPRVIWLGPSQPADSMRAIANRIETLVAPLVGGAEARDFSPHLTLGRVRDPGRGVDWKRAIADVRIVPTVTRVERVTLYQSRLSPKGPTYTALSSHG